MSREPLETMPDVMDAKQLADVLRISKAGAYNLLNSPDFPTLRIGGRKLVMKHDLLENRKFGDSGSQNISCIVQTNSIGKLPHFPGSRAGKNL